MKLKLKFKTILVAITCLCYSSIALSLEIKTCDRQETKLLLSQYQWLTEDYPPFNFTDENNKLVGISTEVLQLVYQTLSLELATQDITILPWARLYRSLEYSQKYAAFSMINTPKRAKSFKLVPFPQPVKVSIMAMSYNQDILINKLKNKKISELTIAVVRQDIGQQLLNENYIVGNQIETVSSNGMLKLLISKRVDAIAYAEDVAYFQLSKLNSTNTNAEIGAETNIDKDSYKYKIVPIVKLSSNTETYTNYAFHKDTPECVTQLFSQTLIQLGKLGEIKKIRAKYLTP